ncbi:hypothetical protein QR680_001538 [Steinernema hermaphroditum]|uniref:SSD domain-containing protein n=1 Tax=Steinernema hermaphroditum TaxID=289476 RepID=A0AA39GYU6_9BILA|nr:hypothetical protein QR680_001538 [Steinernema hermaphroditum]
MSLSQGYNMSGWNINPSTDGPSSSSYPPGPSSVLNSIIEPVQSTSKDEFRTITNASIEVLLDFTRPDGQRTRPLLVDGKRLYVDEHYISVWSPILRAWCIECPDRELILANVQYDHILEMLYAIHPTYKEIDEQTVHILLPIAFDYQMEGLLHRCECFLVNHRIQLLEKIWLADRYKLDRLLVLCLREIRPNHRFDLSGSRYHALSDRVKVFLLERLHGNNAPEEIAEPPTDLEYFQRSSDLNFASIRAKSGRMYYVNPYYIAAWSNLFQERIGTASFTDELFCPCSHEELKAFILAIYPPQLRINETNIGPVLMAACKMESPGLLQKCASILLAPQTQLSVFVRLSLLDRCYLHEMLEQCLRMIHRPEQMLEMSQQQTYDCLSTKARSAMMDRLAVLLRKPGLQSHTCKAVSTCGQVTWMCPQCKTYSSEFGHGQRQQAVGVVGVNQTNSTTVTQQPGQQYTSTQHTGRVVGAIFLSIGAINFKEVNNVRDHFSASDSPSRYEFRVAREFFEELGSPFHVVVAMQATDGGSLLRPKYIEKALEIEDYLQYRLNVTHEGKAYSYSDFCGSQCETSDAVNIFLSIFRDIQSGKASNVKLTYPTMDVFGHRIYLANNIFQVSLNNRSKLIEGCKLVAINFHAIYANSSHEEIMKKWEHAVFDYSTSTIGDPLIRVYATSEGLVSEEVRRTGIKALPLMSVSFIVITIFTVGTSLKRDPVKSKPWEAFLGVLCPLLSLCASFGTMFWLGFEFLPIVTVVPFLVLAIGVDDAFIFLHGWHRCDPSLSVKERLAETLADAGPSITITSLTNILSFAIGAYTPTPAIQMFCIFISVAVVYDYLYQIFFFSAILVFSGRREENRVNSYVWCLVVPEETPSETVAPKKDFILIRFASKFLDVWVDFIMSWSARILLAVIMVAYWAVSVYGVTQIKVGLSSEKLFLDDSPLLDLVRMQTNIIFKEGGQVAVFVNRPGNLTEPEAVSEIMGILDRFEHASGSVGSSSTHMWLLPYLPYVGLQNRGAIDFKYKYLPDFLSIPEYHRWSHFVNLGKPQDCAEEKPSCLQKFFFSTGFHNAVAWSDRLELLQNWREIASEYTHLNLTIYEDFSMYSDQLLTILPVTQQTVIFAFLCMAIVLIFFTPNLYTIISSTIAILSINVGVFGSLTYWNVDLDPISMATTLMAIGFSVDFIAHISFHYYKGEIPDQRERIRHALASIAWPMCQAGLSTVLSLAVLAVIPAYMVQVFVKVVTLVVSLGLFHGLVVLPVVFAMLPFDKTAHAVAPKCETKLPVTLPAPLTMSKKELEKSDSVLSHRCQNRG